LAAVGRFFKAPVGSFFLFGPRGTGKSTWLRQAQRLHQARPERLRQRLDAVPGTGTVVIDEVEKVPALLDVVQAGPALPLSDKQGVQDTS
jgi:ABC-type phosphate transport system ATPase subunit